MIKAVPSDKFDEVLPLIRQYQAFYNAKDISDERNREFFAQFVQQSPLGCQFVAREEGVAVGFASVFFCYASTIASKVAVLNDMYTLPSMRGKGIGRQLIEHSRAFAESRGAARLQWVTALDNEPAQRLYRSLDANESTWRFYTYV